MWTGILSNNKRNLIDNLCFVKHGINYEANSKCRPKFGSLDVFSLYIDTPFLYKRVIDELGGFVCETCCLEL